MISTSTLLIALLSGAGGAVIAKLIETRSSAAQSLRTWRLAAADDFTTGVHQSMLALRNGHNALLDHGTTSGTGKVEIRDASTSQVRPEIKKALDGAQESVDVVVSRLGRVHILFGDTSAAGERALNTATTLRTASEALREWPAPDLAAYGVARDLAHGEHQAFNRAALATLEGGPAWYRPRLAFSRRREISHADAGDDSPGKAG